MPNIPYPEFKDFHVSLQSKVIHGNQPVEGVAKLEMNELQNCVKDILVACRCCFRYRTQDGTVHTVLLYEEIQRNATPFDDDGLPEGEYEFPFSFRCPESLPPSIAVTGGWDVIFNCKIWYEIRAYVMHAENHVLDRKHLRTSVKFQRAMLYNPALVPAMLNTSPAHHSGHVEIRGELSSTVYKTDADVVVNLYIKHELIRNINTVKLCVRQNLKVKKRAMRQVKEFSVSQIITSMSITNNVPIKRYQVFDGSFSIKPEYDDATKITGVALSGKLDANGSSQLAPSVRLCTQEGVEISYCVEVHCSVVFSPDYIITLPFVLTDKIDDDSMPPGYWAKNASTPVVNSVGVGFVGENEDESDEEGFALPSYDETIRRKSLYQVVDDEKTQEKEKDNSSTPLQQAMADSMPSSSDVPSTSDDVATEMPNNNAEYNTRIPPRSRARSVTMLPVPGRASDFIQGSHDINPADSPMVARIPRSSSQNELKFGHALGRQSSQLNPVFNDGDTDSLQKKIVNDNDTDSELDFTAGSPTSSSPPPTTSTSETSTTGLEDKIEGVIIHNDE